MTFNNSLRNRLDKDMRHKEFTAHDFMDLADEYGSPYKTVCGNLLRMEKKGLIVVSKLIRTRKGGNPVKAYRVVKDATFLVRPIKDRMEDHRVKVRRMEKELMAACNRLGKVIDGWVRV